MRYRFRIAFRFPVGRRPRIIIYARYSTEEQHPTSIDDQVAFCREVLKANGIEDAEIIVIFDKEASGELASRPGIDRVRELIDSGWADLLICEDSSRLFRHETACGELIETAYDNDIRVIAINDDLDTADEDWDVHEAASHHAKANKYTIRRIRRKHEGLWRMGAAISLLRSGYMRKATVPASEKEPAKGPFYDEIDPRWAPVVKEVFNRVARKEPPWLVADFATAENLPKCSNAKSPVWTDENIIALIQRPIYRGFDIHRTRITRKKRRSGKRIRVRNEPEETWTRPMEHLRIVPDGLWYAANEAIAERNLHGPTPSGADHALTGIPRDSRGPLSRVFFCGACENKMHREGQQGDGYRRCYRCGASSEGGCWNKATARVEHVHEKIAQAIIATLTSLDGMLDALVEYVRQLYQDDKPRQELRAELNTAIARSDKRCKELTAAVGVSNQSLQMLVDDLEAESVKLNSAKAKLQMLDAEQISREPPSKEQILEKLAAMTKQLLSMDREAGATLERLVGKIFAVPYQQFGSNKVVLRARFDLRLAAFLPDQVLGALGETSDSPLAKSLDVIPIVVDLFERSAGPKHFAEALAMSKAGVTLVEIGKKLGIAKRQAHIAVQFGRDLEAAGLTDPFIELIEPPAAASRWRKHNRLRETG